MIHLVSAPFFLFCSRSTLIAVDNKSMRLSFADLNGAMVLDIMHSCLGLAALAVMKHPELKSIDSKLCMSVSAREHFEEGTALGRGEMLEIAKLIGEL